MYLRYNSSPDCDEGFVNDPGCKPQEIDSKISMNENMREDYEQRYWNLKARVVENTTKIGLRLQENCFSCYEVSKVQETGRKL